MPKKISDLYVDHPVTAFDGTEQIEVNDDGTSGAATVENLAKYAIQQPLASFTVSTLPSAAVAGKLIFVTDESGGAVPAFSDGTDWRRITDREVVT